MADIWMDVDTALSEVPVNILPLLDDTDFKTRETAVAFNASGMDLVWNFVTTAGAYTQTAVTPTSAGDYDWTHQGDGMYSIEIPASGGASINNDTEGFGWFSGLVTGVLPWRGPIIGFRASGLNDLLIDSAFSTTRGLTGTALPAVAAEAAGGLYTRGSGAGQLSQSSNGALGVVSVLTGHTAQTGDNFAIVNNGTHGNAALKTLIDTIDNFLDTEIAAILAAVDTEVAAILALLDDPRGEPGQGAPPASADHVTKVDYLFKAWRNKKDNNGTETKLYADDGSTVDHKQATSESGGTVTKGEWATGA